MSFPSSWLRSLLPADFSARRAVQHNNHEDPQFALAQGANPNGVHAGSPLLVRAVRQWANEGLALADALLRAGADPNGQDREGYTALSHCFDVVGHSWRHPQSGRARGERQAPEKGWTCMRSSHALIVDHRLPHQDDNHVLAYYRSATDVLALLVEAGTGGNVPVAYRDTTDMGLQAWPDAQTTANIAALNLSSLGWARIVAPSEEPLIDAAWRGALALVDRGASPNHPTVSGETLLFGAVRANRPDIVAELLDRGADGAVRNHYHLTAVEAYPQSQQAVAAFHVWQSLKKAPTLPTPARKRM